MKSLSQKEFLEFNRLLSLLLLSKVSIIDALELIKARTKNKILKSSLQTIYNDICKGFTISESFNKQDEIFNKVYIANIKIGEETGNLSEVLNEYTSFLEKFSNLKRKILQASAYPFLIIIVSILVIIFMLVFLIPTFQNLFKSFSSDLPFITKFIISLSNHFLEYYVIIFPIIILFLFLLRIKAFRNLKHHPSVFLLLKNIPYISELYRLILLNKFTLSMSLMLKNNVDLIDSLKIVKNITNNIGFTSEIDLIIKRVVSGQNISEEIIKNYYLDSTFSKMISVGEESAQLDQVFIQLFDFYSKELDNRISNITSLFEPLLILFIGVVVGLILISMYLPLFDLINYVGY